MHSHQFNIAGMPSSSSSHGGNIWSLSTGSGPLGTSLSDSGPRPHYQPGYIMSVMQDSELTQSRNITEHEVPIIQTKAKLMSGSRRTASDFGMESMFESRPRPTLPDEDAPPMNSVSEIPQKFHAHASMSRSPSKKSQPDRHALMIRRRSFPPGYHLQPPPFLNVVVFGYTPDHYDTVVEYFKSLGESSAPQPHAEIVNCFTIGYKDYGDALRAVRRNGEVVKGTWMVGVKWADPIQAEILIGQANLRLSALNSSPGPTSLDGTNGDGMPHRHLYIGTPVKLAPSSTAFRPTTPGGVLHTVQSILRIEPPKKGLLGKLYETFLGW